MMNVKWRPLCLGLNGLNTIYPLASDASMPQYAEHHYLHQCIFDIQNKIQWVYSNEQNV